MKPEIIFQSSAWYILLCVIIAGVLAYFLYRKSKFKDSKAKLALSILRALLIFCITFLLLNPLIKTINSIIQKPKVVLLIDDSKSMKYGGENLLENLKTQIIELKNDFEVKGFEIEINNLSDQSKITEKGQIQFTASKTNLASAINNIKSNYEGQNLSDLILLSDGIINDGVSPTYQQYPFNVHSLAFGDTTAKKDLRITGIAANKIAYLGNKFSVNADISAVFYAGSKAQVLLKNASGNILARKEILIKSQDDFASVSFELIADKIGKQRYIIEISPLTGEFTLKNNIKDFIVDVVDGKEKILIVASAPHPDLKALKSILEKNESFEVKLDIQPSVLSTEQFDILILHQMPDVSGAFNTITSQLMAKRKPVLHFIGSKSNISIVNGMQEVVGINAQLNKLDKVGPSINNMFQRFQISPQSADILAKMPPILVPFGDYNLSKNAETILYQKIGNIPTNKPILSLNLNTSPKSAVFVGEGLWQWRLEEFALSENQLAIDELILKSLELISVKDDKNKLQVYPLTESFNIDQNIIFEAETYNNLYEKIYGQSINLKVTGANSLVKNFNFKTDKDNNRFTISNLPAGVYSYSASSSILGKNEISNGQFVITETDLEALNPTADFGILKTLAADNNGVFLPASKNKELLNLINQKGLTSKAISREELKDLINIKWLLFLILLLAALEWGFRKYLGSY